MRTGLIVLSSLLALTASIGSASAQTVMPRQQSSIDGIEVLTGLMDYDLSGTGQTMPLSIRGMKSLTHGLALEFGATFASPDQQFGTSRLTLPEARLTYSWGTGRWRPFVSGGGGLAVTTSDVLRTRWRPSLMGGGGLRVHLNDHLYAIGEMRLRGVSPASDLSNFGGTTAEWLGGIGWRFR